MEQWIIMLSVVASVFIAIVIGAISRRVNWLTHEADESLLKVIVHVLVPCLIFSVICGNERMLDFENVWKPPIVGFTSVAFGCMVAWFFVKLFGSWLGITRPQDQRTFAVCMGLFNYGYVPLPLVMSLYVGDNGTLGVLLSHNVGVELAMWTVCVLLFSGGLSKKWWQRIFNPPLIAIVIAQLLNLTGMYIYVPDFVMSATYLLGQAAIPMGLIFVGATMVDHFKPAEMKGGLRIIISAAVLRLGFMAITFIMLAKYLPLSIELKRVLLVEASMPPALFTVVLAKHYGGSPSLALKIILTSSLIGLATIPLWLLYGGKIIFG